MCAFSIVIFTQPAHIPIGGVTGIAMILNFLFGFPAGVLNAVLNIPLIVIAFKSFGRIFLLRTVYAVAMISVFLDMLPKFVPVYHGDILITLLFGGVIGGGRRRPHIFERVDQRRA